MTYRPINKHGGWLGLLMGIILFGFILWGINFSLTDNERVLKLLLLIPAYAFLVGYVYVLLGAFSINYKVDKDALEIKWGLHKKRIPWSDFDEIIGVKGRLGFLPVLGISWPGYIFGVYTAQGIGTVRMCAANPKNGFICLKTKQGFFGITPRDKKCLTDILDNTGKKLHIMDADQMVPEQKEETIEGNQTFGQLYKLNILLIIILAVYLAIFFPGSGASSIVIILLVLAIAIFFFTTSNAKIMWRFSNPGAYVSLLTGSVVTGIFIILSIIEVSF